MYCILIAGIPARGKVPRRDLDRLAEKIEQYRNRVCKEE